MDLHMAVRLYGAWRIGDGGYSPTTWAGEAPGLMAFADYAVDEGVVTFDDLSDRFLGYWWTHVQANYTEATAVTRLSQLRGFVGHAIKRGWLAEDPTLFIRARRPAPELRDRLTAGELLAMIEAADYPQHRIVLALCANLALRQSEMKRLTIRDVDLLDGTITVRPSKRQDVAPDPMPITAELGAELRAWVAHYRSRVGGLTAASHLVPAQHVGSQGVTYNPTRSIGEPEDVIKRALTKLGWEETKGEGIHTVRRSVARIFFDAVLEEEGDGKFDEALLGCMRLLHHDRAETTLRYIGIDRQTLARDKFLRGRSFLSRVAGPARLAVAQ